ncbi:MAG: hypothetical protein IV086_12550 [Hyphomonadaceae bacterium]|nr:hypothetical protein [Hyphomonadaceae bacterium]
MPIPHAGEVPVAQPVPPDPHVDPQAEPDALLDPFPFRRPPPGELPSDPRARLVADVLAYATGVAAVDILGRDRGNVGIARLRHVAMYLFSTVYTVSTNNTAHVFGRDRTTAQYAMRKIEDAREAPAFDQWIASLEATLIAAPNLGGRA